MTPAHQPVSDTLHVLLPPAAGRTTAGSQPVPFRLGGAWQVGDGLYTQVQDDFTGRFAVFATRASGHVERVTGYSWDINPVWRQLTGPSAPRATWSQLRHEHVIHHAAASDELAGDDAETCEYLTEDQLCLPQADGCAVLPPVPQPSLGARDPLEDLWEESAPSGGSVQKVAEGVELLYSRVARFLDGQHVPPLHERAHAQHPDAALSSQLLRAYDTYSSALALQCAPQAAWFGAWAYGIAEELVWRSRLGQARKEAERIIRGSMQCLSYESHGLPSTVMACAGFRSAYDEAPGY
ncbi:hypothetical protein [Streptomyces bugieae]|uniref:Uncharacterized protein n=1 Tax=Streptomyces bugieae TaxID=3098223 RepID=A0ABU7NJB9_9ACTN|nr:hypothetical protein [Streptomyces sp. DSM 41528]